MYSFHLGRPCPLGQTVTTEACGFAAQPWANVGLRADRSEAFGARDENPVLRGVRQATKAKTARKIGPGKRPPPRLRDIEFEGRRDPSPVCCFQSSSGLRWWLGCWREGRPLTRRRIRKYYTIYDAKKWQVGIGGCLRALTAKETKSREAKHVAFCRFLFGGQAPLK